MTVNPSSKKSTAAPKQSQKTKASAKSKEKSAGAVVPEVVEDSEDETKAEEAYQALSDFFKKHITAFMLEAGQYIIDTFYGGNARKALAKNKASDNPASLKLLIEKLQSAKSDPSENAPSVSWFYKAVSLAAHESICNEMGLSTFTILGHSHKLQLLNVPKLKQIKGDEFDEKIEPAFKEKEKLAEIAIKENLSVRDFAKKIRESHPDNPTNLTINNLPDNKGLEKLKPKRLEGLNKKLGEQIADLEKRLAQAKKEKGRVEGILSKKSHEDTPKGKSTKKADAK